MPYSTILTSSLSYPYELITIFDRKSLSLAREPKKHKRKKKLGTYHYVSVVFSASLALFVIGLVVGGVGEAARGAAVWRFGRSKVGAFEGLALVALS